MLRQSLKFSPSLSQRHVCYVVKGVYPLLACQLLYFICGRVVADCILDCNEPITSDQLFESTSPPFAVHAVVAS